MGAIGNFLWFVFGGVFMGLCWWLLGLLAFIAYSAEREHRFCSNVNT